MLACSEPEKKMVIIDARNIYETRIGKFDLSSHENSANLKVLDPKSRQVSKSLNLALLLLDM